MIAGVSTVTQRDWPVPGQRAIASSSEPLADAEIQRLTEDIKKEESELKKINREFSRYLSDGAQDMAKLKSVEITQKQMQIQSMRFQVSKLENPEQSGGAADSAATNAAGARFDRFVKSGEQPEESPGLYRLETDGSGQMKIIFDRAADPETPGKKPGGREKKQVEVGKSVADKSAWEAEIAKIERKQAELLRQIGSARDDEEEQKDVKAELARIEGELAQKDTDAYRKSRTPVRYLGSTRMDAADAVKLG